MSMIYRKDSWTHEEDKILADTMLEMSQIDGVTIEQAFEETAKRLNDRTDKACQARWYIIKPKLISFYERQEEFENAQLTTKHNGEAPEDYLDKLLNDEFKKKEEPKVVGVYLEEKVANILGILGKMGGRGAKSRIVNDALRNLFIGKGLL